MEPELLHAVLSLLNLQRCCLAWSFQIIVGNRTTGAAWSFSFWPMSPCGREILLNGYLLRGEDNQVADCSRSIASSFCSVIADRSRGAQRFRQTFFGTWWLIVKPRFLGRFKSKT